MGRIRVTVERLGDLAALEASWRALEATADASFFRSWAWIGCWLAEAAATPWTVTARDGGRVVGLGLLVRARRRGRFRLGVDRILLQETGDPAIDLVYAEYNGLLAERGREAEVAAAAVEALVSGEGLPAEFRRWDELRLGGVGLEYLELARRTGLEVHVADEQPSAAVDLDAVRARGGDYLAGLSPNTRQQIRRARRLYEERGPLALDVARDAAEAEGFLDSLAELHQRTWESRGQGGAFRSPFFGRFHRALIRRSHPEGAVELLRVRAGEAPVGYLYNLVRGSWVGNYASGFAYEEDARLKPGLLCFQMAVERHAAGGASCFDFMAGGQRYKTSLGAPGPRLYWFDLRRPRLAFRIEAAARRVRDLLRPERPSLPAEA